jgi:hypothetical protein
MSRSYIFSPIVACMAVAEQLLQMQETLDNVTETRISGEVEIANKPITLVKIFFLLIMWYVLISGSLPSELHMQKLQKKKKVLPWETFSAPLQTTVT